jgi:DNA modification methylase
MVLAGSKKGDVVLDPFIGSGITAIVARKLGRNYIGIELNKKYCEIAEERIKAIPEPMF